MKYRWDKFLIEGDNLYNYMINNLQNMFDEDNIKHFEIIDELYSNIQEIHCKDIQKELILWIKNELLNNRLFDQSLWKPFRKYNLIDMYLGYKYLFQYKQYYFQLGIQTYCELEECIYCNHKKDIYFEEYSNNSQHFMLSLYGWKEDNINILQPYKSNIILLDNIMPENHWLSG